MRHRFVTLVLLAVGAALLLAAGSAPAQEKESPSAKATRKKLKKKISVDFAESRMKDAMNDIKLEFDNRLGIKIDNVSGVSNNSKVTFKADDQPLEKILNDFCKKYEIGWFVLSKPGDRYDGWIIIRKSNERGYEKGKEPATKGALAAPPPLPTAEPVRLVAIVDRRP
jgi:hypothetical protein